MPNFLSIVPFPYRILALVVLALSLVGFGWVKGAQHGEAKLDAYKAANDKAVQAQVLKAAQTTADLNSDALILERVKNDQLKAISSRLDRALSELRDRPARRANLPELAASHAGATGPDLSREDAELVSREAARNDAIAAERNQCIAAYAKARESLGRSK